MGDLWREAAADMAKLQASRAFVAAKRQALSVRHRHGESPRWPLADMRNAVVAYHAGASWMTDTASAMAALRGLNADLIEMMDDNVRLCAEVERLQKRWDQHMEAARHAEERVCHRIDNFERCGECEACLLLDSERDALAREDGDSDG